MAVCEGCGQEYPSWEAADRCAAQHEAEDRHTRQASRRRLRQRES